MTEGAALLTTSPSPASMPEQRCPTGQHPTDPWEFRVHNVPAYIKPISLAFAAGDQSMTNFVASNSKYHPLCSERLTSQHDPLLQQLAPCGQHPLLPQHVSCPSQTPGPHVFCRLRIERTALPESCRGGVLTNVCRISNAGGVMVSSRLLKVANGVTKVTRTAKTNSRSIL